MTVFYNPDFADFLKSLEESEVRYLVVDGYSVIFHGYSRTTGDLDISVEPTGQNYRNLLLAFNRFGLAVFDMTAENFLNNPQMDVFTFGRSPVCIQIMTKVKGLDFETAFNDSVSDTTSFGTVRYLSLPCLNLPNQPPVATKIWMTSII